MCNLSNKLVINRLNEIVEITSSLVTKLYWLNEKEITIIVAFTATNRLIISLH